MNRKKWMAIGLALCLMILCSCRQDEPEHSNEWGISMKAVDVSAEGLTLVLKREGGQVTGNVIYGNPYWLERQTSEGWVQVDFLESEDAMLWTMEAYALSDGEETEIPISWGNRFGKLEPGHYRIGKVFSGRVGQEDRDETFYGEFEV